jgi:hypothetical protein
MERFALYFTVKPGTEEKAAELLTSYGRPSTSQASSNTQLLSTTVFMKDNVIVRVFDIEGSLEDAMAFLPQQEAIRRVEAELNPLLEHPRPLTNAEEARQFFERSLMKRLTHRVAGKPL